MLFKACLNGNRAPAAHPALPVTPAALAEAAQRAVAAGAGALHVHPRRADTVEALDADTIGAAVAAIRAACPGVPVGVSTGAWIEPDLARRVALICEWKIKPDFASVNFSEEGVADVCAALFDSGVGVEPGLADAKDAQLLVTLGIAERCVRLLIEPDGATVEAARANVTAIEAVLDAAQIRTSRLLHGFESTAWPLLDDALQRGYDTRIGFEDTLLLPDGTSAPDNAALVAAASTRSN